MDTFDSLVLPNANSTDLLFEDTSLEDLLAPSGGVGSPDQFSSDLFSMAPMPSLTVKDELPMTGVAMPSVRRMAAVARNTAPLGLPPLSLPPLSTVMPATAAVPPPPTTIDIRPAASSMDLPTTSEAGLSSAHGAGDTELDEAGHTSTRRRRRIRDTRQQELNRLAQQRYRQRKKQRQSDLQTTVDALSNQLEQLRTLENEVTSLQKTNVELRKHLAAQQSTLAAAHDKLAAQERTIAAQRELIDAQQAQLDQAQAVSAQSVHLANVDPVTLSDHLCTVLKTVMSEVGLQSSSAQQGPALQETMLRVLNAHLSSCWRDIRVPGNQQPSTHKAPAPITVSCC